MDDFFSIDYWAARESFLAASQGCRAHVDSFRNELAERDGQFLFTDVAVVGDVSAENVLVLMSGTHGVEGFAGSAIQTGVMRSGSLCELGCNLKVVMIHAINPYGFAWLRRTNEDNIDLNRNFMDYSAALPANPDYDRLAAAISPANNSMTSNFLGSLRFVTYRACHGAAALQRAVTRGQYSHPQGLFYGGTAPSWSNLTLAEICSKFLVRAKRVVFVDVHTGLGPYGYGELIINEPVSHPAFSRALACWGKERVKSTVTGDSVSSQLSGCVNLAISRMLAGADVTAVGLEFGTLPAMEVFNRMRSENWLHHYGGDNHKDSKPIRSKFLQAFCPVEEGWRQAVWEQGGRIVKRALQALGESHRGADPTSLCR